MQASLVQKQQFGLKMNPQIYQSMKLMEMPIIDLREKIEEELERNPALEVLSDGSTVSLNETEPRHREIEEYFESSSDSGFMYRGSGGAAAADKYHQFIEGVLSRPETLQEHLLWQLQLERTDDELRTIAATLIQNLDDDGFHKEPPETLFKAVPPRLPQAIRIVQMLDPVGCCTANYREALKVQISLLRDTPSCMDCSLDHLEYFERGKITEAAKKMHCNEEEARACYNMIKKLSPFPGRRFSTTDIRFVIPDIKVVRDRDEGDFKIIINNEVIPSLGIDPFFRKLNSGSHKSRSIKDSPAREFARENVREAKVFINSLAMRNYTIKRVARSIVEFQRSFFDKGPQHLAPLTLGDIADELGIHKTTVSRAAHDKYMQTEWGIFELRSFFTNSITGSGSTGSHFSKEGVKAVIKELINNDEEHLSDNKITDLLEQRGISIARRTVAKYRNELDMGSSYSR